MNTEKPEFGLLLLGSKKYKDYMALYDVIKAKKYIELRYSPKQSDWCHPGKPAYSLTNTGNGLIFTDEKTGEALNLDYSQAAALRALLKLEDTDGSTFNYIKVK